MTETDNRLKLHIEAVENLLGERKAIQEDISERYKLMRSEGYEPKVVRAIIKERAMKPAERKEAEELLTVYKCNLGMED